MNNSFWRWRRPAASETTNTESQPLSGAAEALISIFGDDEVSDVRIQGCDGGKVVAVKAILACRSPLFRQKFFGEKRSHFVPAKPGDMEVVIFKDWDCRILHLIVEYCYTDTCSVMKCLPTEDIARLLAKLRVASKVFKLPGLLERIRQWVRRQIGKHPGLACSMVDEGMNNDDIDELALQTLQLKARASLLPNEGAVGSGVLALSKPGLLFVLRTLEDTTSHYLLLQTIEQWVDFSSEGCSGDSSPDRDRASREAFGRKCAMRFIKLSKLPKQNLDTLQERSRLFTNADGTIIPLSQTSANFSSRSLSPTPAGSSLKQTMKTVNLRNINATNMVSSWKSSRNTNLSSSWKSPSNTNLSYDDSRMKKTTSQLNPSSSEPSLAERIIGQ